MGSDQFAVRAVIIGLIAVLIILSGGMVYLAKFDITIPDSVDRLAFLVAGSVGTILARTSSDKPQDVQVVNEMDEAVPTTVAAKSTAATKK